MRFAMPLGLLVSVFLTAASSFAGPAFQIVPLENGHIRLVFEDGREAETFTTETAPQQFPVKMEMTENICHVDQEKPHCSLIIPGSQIGVKALWTKNPDTSKLKKSVEYSLYGTKLDIVSEQIFRSFGDRQSIGIEPWKSTAHFACDDYAWLTGIPGDTIPKWNNFLSWGGEINVTNFETNVSDNMTLLGALNIRMTAIYGRMFQIESDQLNSIVGPSLPLVSSGPTSLTYRGQDGEICQAIFNQDASKAIKILKDAVKESADRYEKGFISKKVADDILVNLNEILNRMKNSPEQVRVL